MTTTITDNELRVRGFSVLVQAFGDVNAERFIALINREPFDYTEWRKENLFVDETVDSLMDQADALYGDSYPNRADTTEPVPPEGGCVCRVRIV